MIHILNTISCWLIAAFVPEYTRLESLTLPQMLNPNQRKSLILTSPQNVATRLYLFLFSTLPNHHHHRHHHVHENHHQHLYLSFPCSLPWQRSLWPRKWSSTHSKSWETLKEWGEKFNFRDFFSENVNFCDLSSAALLRLLLLLLRFSSLGIFSIIVINIISRLEWPY